MFTCIKVISLKHKTISDTDVFQLQKVDMFKAFMKRKPLFKTVKVYCLRIFWGGKDKENSEKEHKVV